MGYRASRTITTTQHIHDQSVEKTKNQHAARSAAFRSRYRLSQSGYSCDGPVVCSTKHVDSDEENDIRRDRPADPPPRRAAKEAPRLAANIAAAFAFVAARRRTPGGCPQQGVPAPRNAVACDGRTYTPARRASMATPGHHLVRTDGRCATQLFAWCWQSPAPPRS